MRESLFEEWVEKADEDFRAASALEPDDVPGVICFHCQQCVEKYLNAALVRHSEAAQRTHNLIVLNDMVAEHDERFAAFPDRLETLNPYSVLARYPGIETTAENAKEALKAARALRNEIRKLLNLEVRE